MKTMARLGALALAALIAAPALAQDADHPANKPMVVGSDFGVAPWMVRHSSYDAGVIARPFAPSDVP